ncbi:putative serine protease K12H4.7 [Discoglossus pictus]
MIPDTHVAGTYDSRCTYNQVSLYPAFYVSRFHRRTVENLDFVQEHWFVQKLDHYGVDARVWNQRYFVNDTFAARNGPVFLMIGGESTVNPAWMTTGTWMTYAKKLGALCLLLEHRFYGKSKPTEDLSTENLCFLSSNQALADIAHFQTEISKKLKLGNRKWVIFGGSYPGSLAAWYRLKYPHLAYAAVASSAPVNAKVNLLEYLEVVQASLKQYNAKCPKIMKQASDRVVHLIQNPKNYQKITNDFNDSGVHQHQIKPFFVWQLSPSQHYVWLIGVPKEFRLCTLQNSHHFLSQNPIQVKFAPENFLVNLRLCELLQIASEMDKSYLLDTLAQNVMDIVQYDRDNREFEGALGTNITIQVLCDTLMNESAGEPYNRYAKFIHIILEAMGEMCIDGSYMEYLQQTRNTSWEASLSNDGDRQWVYQLCTELGFFQSTDSTHQPFSGFPLSFWVQQCIDTFGPEFNMSMITNAVQATNEFYGGFNIKGSRIIFPNGLLDPWHSMGILTNSSSDLIAIQIPGASHCADMYPARPEEPDILPSVRESIFKILTKWLQA